MKKTILSVIAVIACITCTSVFAQSKTGQICFIRNTGFNGSAVNFKVYIDDSLACKLKNKTYSIHAVPVGKHNVASKNTGLGSTKKSAPFEVDVKEGKITYVAVINSSKVYCEEITEASGAKQVKTLVENTKCSTQE